MIVCIEEGFNQNQMQLTDMTSEQRAEVMRLHDAAVQAGEPKYVDPISGHLCSTTQKHFARGHCCESACRHCPYGFNAGGFNNPE